MSQFIYLLNAMENAAQQKNPAEYDYRGKRNAVLEYVATLESRAPAPEQAKECELAASILRGAISALHSMNDPIQENARQQIRQAISVLNAKPQAQAEQPLKERIEYLENCLRHIGMDLEMLGLNTDDVEAALGGKFCKRAEPVATLLLPDPDDERSGFWLSLKDREKLASLPAGTKLYTHPIPAAPAAPDDLIEALEKGEGNFGGTNQWNETIKRAIQYLKAASPEQQGNTK